MGKVKDVVSNLVQMLEASQKEAKSLVNTMHELQSCLEEESNTIICGGLDRLLSTIRMEAAKRTRPVVVLIPPDWMVSVGETYDVNSDSWLERLKSQGFSILTLEQFGRFIRSLQLEVTQGNYMPAIEVLRANAKIERPFVYPDASPVREVERPREASTSSGWKLSDFLPAPPPHPPLPRGLFKD
jgi:hypothetical protein